MIWLCKHISPLPVMLRMSGLWRDKFTYNSTFQHSTVQAHSLIFGILSPNRSLRQCLTAIWRGLTSRACPRHTGNVRPINTPVSALGSVRGVPCAYFPLSNRYSVVAIELFTPQPHPFFLLCSLFRSDLSGFGSTPSTPAALLCRAGTGASPVVQALGGRAATSVVFRGEQPQSRY